MTDSHFTTLPDAIREQLLKAGITEPTAIQAQVYEPIMEGRDILAQSRTGSGKTLAFALPAAMRLSAKKTGLPKMLVVTPTRELADQIATVFKTTLASLNYNVALVVGGASYTAQLQAMRRGADIVIGTPGRLVDLMDRKALDVSQVEMFVLDEVDQMLDFGFSESLDAIKKSLPMTKQILFFSATFNDKVRRVARSLLTNPYEAKVNDESKSTIEHGYVEVGAGKNLEALVNILLYYTPSQAIIFCQTKQECSAVYTALVSRNLHSGMLNGDMKQTERNMTMKAFKENRLSYLVATDVAARGIDVAALSHVINFNVPDKVESYTHRVGRTGRAGVAGQAWTIVSKREARQYSSIVQRTKITPKQIELPCAKKIAAKKFNDIKASLSLTEENSKDFHNLIDGYLDSLTAQQIRQGFYHLLDKQVAESMAGAFFAKEIGVGSPSSFKPSDRPSERSSSDRGGSSRGGYGKSSSTSSNYKGRAGASRDGFKKDGFKADGPKKESFRTDAPKKESFRTDAPKKEFKKDAPRKEGFKKAGESGGATFAKKKSYSR